MADEQMDGGNGVDDFDDDLLDEDEAANVPDAPPTRTPAKKKGRKKKGGKGDGSRVAPRPFVESQLSQTLAKTDIGELMNRYDWDSGEYTASLRRVQPQSYNGKNIQGFIATFTERLNEDTIRDKFGGGVYDIVVRGPHPRAGGNSCYLGGMRVKISGDPKLPPDDAHAGGDFGSETALFLTRPQTKPPSLSQIQAARQRSQAQAQGGGLGMATYDPRAEDRRDKMVEMSFSAMQQHAAEAAREAQRLQSQLLEQATKDKGGTTDAEVLRLMRESNESSNRVLKETYEKTMEIQKEAQERIERDRERLETMMHRPGGLPPEMINTMIENHRAEMNALTTQLQGALSDERRRHDNDMKQLRDQYEARLVDERKHTEEVRNREREARERELHAAREEAKRQLDNAANQHRMELESKDRFHDMQIQQMQGQNESNSTVIKTTMEQQIVSLKDELQRTRDDLRAAQEKVQAHGDLSTQAANLKGIMTNLQSVFAPPRPEMPAIPTAEPEEEMPKGWLGTLIKFGDSKLGQTVLGTLATAFQQQMMPPMGALPGASYPGGYPGAYGGYPGGAPSPQYPTYPQQPQQPPYNPYVQQQQDEEYDEVEGVEVPLEDEPEVVATQQPDEAPAPPEPEISSRIGADGVVRGRVSPSGRPAYLGPEEEGAPASGANTPSEVATPGQAQGRPQSPPGPTPEELISQMSPQMREQLQQSIAGIEESMLNGTSPADLAMLIVKLQDDPAQLHDLVATGADGLAAQAMAIKPGTMLATRQGRKYLRALISAVNQYLQSRAQAGAS